MARTNALEALLVASIVLFGGLVASCAPAGEGTEQPGGTGGNGTGGMNGTGGVNGTGGMNGTGGTGGACDPDGAELVDNVVDDDCDGLVDEVDLCDDTLTLDSTDALDATRAIELCKVAIDQNDWGVITARWVQPAGEAPPAAQIDNYHLGHGLLGDFGPNVPAQVGDAFVALSTGAARNATDPGYQGRSFDKGYASQEPAGFPFDSDPCEDISTHNDGVALEIELRVPPNAGGFRFDFNYYTLDFPDAICAEFTDQFIAIVSPAPMGTIDGNISFDSIGNPVSVNNAFFDVCECPVQTPCTIDDVVFDCSLGTDLLQGTGYEPAGATGWLVTNAPVEPNDVITIRFAIWDTGDGVFDSTVLVDNFQWIADPGTTVGTEPIPEPR